VCGESYRGLGGCSGELPWFEAQEFCTNAGARLCSADELGHDEARATGCGLDRKRVWSDSECGDGSYLTAYGASFAGTETVCEEATRATIPARCCANVFLAPPVTPSQKPVISPTSEPTPLASTCEDLGWTNADSYGSSEVCGESYRGLGGCSGELPWFEAQEFCTNAGARLCSADELGHDEARATGCGLDRKQVWSDSECGDGRYLALHGASFAGTETVCKEATSASISARCCADVSSSPLKPSQEPVISPTSEPTKISTASFSTCEDLGWTNAPVYGSTNVCGESDFMLKGCSGSLSFLESVQFCESPGARLCTAEELQADEARGTGCSGDNLRVRSSDKCTGGHIVTIGSSRGSSASCRSDESIFLVRCCADVESTRRLAPGISLDVKSHHLRGTMSSI